MYYHICEPKQCTACKRKMCTCKMTCKFNNKGYRLICPFCGASMIEVIMTTNSTVVLNEAKNGEQSEAE